MVNNVAATCFVENDFDLIISNLPNPLVSPLSLFISGVTLPYFVSALPIYVAVLLERQGVRDHVEFAEAVDILPSITLSSVLDIVNFNISSYSI